VSEELINSMGGDGKVFNGATFVADARPNTIRSSLCQGRTASKSSGSAPAHVAITRAAVFA
jgi:hypothetical protein